MNRITPTLVSIAVAAASTACGGSGGSGLSLPSAELATITSANAPTIAGAVMASTFEGSDLGDFANLAGGVPVASAAPTFSKVVAPGNGMPSLLDGLGQGVAEAPFDQTVACPGGGSLTMSGDIANPETLSGGDSVAFSYDSCDNGVTVVDGVFSMVVSSFSGDLATGSFSLFVTVTLTDFSVTEDGATAIADGSVSIDLIATSPASISIGIGSSSLTVAAGGTTHTLSSFSLDQTLDVASGAYTLTVTGSLTSSAFDGTVDFETSAALEGTADGYAFTGELVIEGANGASITVIALDATMVRLEVDTDGDGEIDDVIDRSWDELV